MDTLQIFLTVCAGIALSAACGFRVFLPLLCLSVAAYTGNLHLSDSFAWAGSIYAVITFSVATVVEIAAYYVPWIDNLLDTIAAPTAILAGVLVTASVVTDLPPFWRWTLAAIAGGGAATVTQLTTTKVRALSSATTGGLGNPVLSTIEWVVSSIISVLAVIAPIVAFVLVLVILAVCLTLIYLVGKKVIKFFRRRKTQPA